MGGIPEGAEPWTQPGLACALQKNKTKWSKEARVCQEGGGGGGFGCLSNLIFSQAFCPAWLVYTESSRRGRAWVSRRRAPQRQEGWAALVCGEVEHARSGQGASVARGRVMGRGQVM